MIKAGRIGVGLVVSAWALIQASEASAQMAPAPQPSRMRRCRPPP